MDMEEIQTRVAAVIQDPTLTFHQRRHYLAAIAENILPYPEISAACAEAVSGLMASAFSAASLPRP